MMNCAEWDHSEELAETIGLPMAVWGELFGLRWRLNEAEPWHDFDSDPSGGEGFPATPWHLKGDPAQLMLRVFAHGIFIARPKGIRTRAGGIDIQPSGQEYVAARELEDLAPEIVKWMLTSRRRQFRWCSECWQHTPPEEWVGGSAALCVWCAESDSTD